MLRFRYRAADVSGKKFGGVVEAISPVSAIRLLNDRGLMVMSLRNDLGGIFALVARLASRVGLGELATFTRQLSTMVNAGITLTEAFSILKDQLPPNLGFVVEQIQADIEAGLSLSVALEKHPEVFSRVYVASVRAGETGGILDQVLSRLADSLEKEREFRGKVVGALIYPVIIIIAMIIVAFIMMVFVVPRLSQVFLEFEATLPVPTRVLIFVSGIMSRFWWVLIALVFLGAWAFILFRKTPFGRRRTDELMLKIPVFGPLIRQIILTEFTRTLGLLIGVGVSILESLRVVSSITGNEVISRATRGAAASVEKGLPLAYSLGQQSDSFPLILSRMIAVGEETGKLDEVLGKVSHILEVESDTQVRALTTAMEPVIMIILGIMVGFMVIAIILPIYNLTSHI